MEAAFRAIPGGLVSTDADGPRLSKHFGMSKDRFKEVEKEHNQDESSGIFNVNDLDFETLFKETIMEKYLSYWEQWRTLKR